MGAGPDCRFSLVEGHEYYVCRFRLRVELPWCKVVCFLGDVMVVGGLVAIFVSDEDIERGIDAPFVGASRYDGTKGWADGLDLE